MSIVATLFNYYPKYNYLDNILSDSGKRKLNIYVDLKGCMNSLYLEHAVRYIISQSSGGVADPSIFASTLDFIAFHKLYARKRRIDLNMVFFYEDGDSSYHKNIYKDYKSNRSLRSFFGLDSDSIDLFNRVKDKNFDLIEKVCNKLPNVSVVRLKFLEADFIPWYVQNSIFDNDQETANVIYSMDKDMLQCLNENTYMFYKHYKVHKIIDKDSVYNHYFKQTVPWNVDPELFFLILALDGDISDEYKGVKGIGTKTLIKEFPDLLKHTGSAQEIIENIKTGNSIFKKDIGTNSKVIQRIFDNEEIVVRNIKLASYRILADHVNSGYPLTNVERRKHIFDRVQNTQKITNPNVLVEALDKIGMTSLVQEHSVYNIFN
jgi:5'-3' exonuclease